MEVGVVHRCQFGPAQQVGSHRGQGVRTMLIIARGSTYLHDVDPQFASGNLANCPLLCGCACFQSYPSRFRGNAISGQPPAIWDAVLVLELCAVGIEVVALRPEVAGGSIGFFAELACACQGVNWSAVSPVPAGVSTDGATSPYGQ